jgi:hypothetical protein
MDVKGAIAGLVSRLKSGKIQQATMTEFSDEKGKTESGNYKFQFNPSTMTVNQVNSQTPGGDGRLAKSKDGVSDHPPVFVEGTSLSFDVVIDHSEVRPTNPLERAGYMLHSLNPLFVPIRSLKHVLKEPSKPLLPWLSNSTDVADYVQIWYRWSRAQPRDSGGGGEDSTQGDARVFPLTFTYGTFVFKGSITRINVKLSVFDEEGHPRRADISVSMKGSAQSWEKPK